MNNQYVFLSYSHKDQESIKQYANSLRKEGYKIIYDEEMSAGDDWLTRARHFIRSEDCACVVFFISDASIISKPVLEEVIYTKRYEKKYFSVMLDNEDVQTKFRKLNKNPNISDELVDVADQMQDYFPSTKLFIPNNEKTIQDIITAFKDMDIECNKKTSEIIENIKIQENNLEEPQFVIIEGANVTKEDILSALELDMKYFDIDNSDQFTIEKCMNWFEINNTIYTMIKDVQTNKVVAYINAAPITDECYEDIREGKYADAEINDEHIVSYDLPGLYNLYFASVVVDQSYQNIGILKYIYDTFVEKMIKLLERDIVIERVIADAISSKGRKFCELFGMKKIKNETNHNSTIYEVKMFPPQFKVSSKATKKLYDYYQKKVNELDY